MIIARGSDRVWAELVRPMLTARRTRRAMRYAGDILPAHFQEKMVEKLWGNYAIWFGFFDNGLWRELMVSLVIFSESISSGQSVLIKIWCSVEILKLISPKKVTLAKLNGNSLLYRNHRIYGVSPPLSCFLWWPSTIGKLSEIMYVHHICNS